MKSENRETTMTFTNRIKIGNKKIRLDDLPAEEQIAIANRLIYQPLTTIQNIEVIQTAYRRPCGTSSKKTGIIWTS